MVTVQTVPRRLAPADWVTTARLVLAGVVAVLVSEAVAGSTAGTTTTGALVALASTALALDAVDGWVARRTGTASARGARYDMEVDAFLVLVLSAYAAVTTAWWAVLIGLARYLLLAAGWRWPWLRAETPPRYWAKVVAAVQGVVLVTVAAGVLPQHASRWLLLGALVLLTESFAHQVRTLRRLRVRDADRTVRRGRRSPLPTTLAAAVVLWLALVLPSRPGDLGPSALLRFPIELIGVLALGAVVGAARPRRWLCGAVGLLLGLLVVVKVANIGFYLALDRPVHLLDDTGLVGSAWGVLRDADGTGAAVATAVGALAAGIAVLVLVPLAAVRVGSSAARRRRATFVMVTVLAVLWGVAATTGVRLAGSPVVSDGTLLLAVDQVRLVRGDLADRGAYSREIATDAFAAVPGDRLLTGLRGKDVVVAFVESYGRVAVEGSSFSPAIDRLLDRGTARLSAAGLSARSAFLTSPTFGGQSWLAHSTLQSGTWVDSSHRYDELIASDRLTLARAFSRAGWRTVFDIPSVRDGWPAGQRFYGFDRLYDAANVGYRGPSFGYATMPDQFTWATFAHRELDPADRPPVMAEIDLVSSHVPWTPLPSMVPWSRVGDGSVFASMPAGQPSAAEVLGDADRVRAAYATSVRYTLRALVSFLEHHPDPNLVLVVLGDHQPNSSVSGPEAGHDVPVSLVAHDPHVLHRIAGWRWSPGLRPAPDAPVWPMDAFRDRFLTAFGPDPVPGH